MAAYATGTVKVTAGSSKVFGTLTEWNVYTQIGDLFKINSDVVFYEIAGINSATELTLTSRYSNTSYQSAVATNIASVNTATKQYSGTLSNTPVLQNSIVVEASPTGGGERFSDNGAGVLVGEASPAGSGTVDYDSGLWTLTLGTPVTGTLNLTASYNRGVIGQGLPYQVISDFTPNYNIPEMSLNDINFPHIYTKAMRTIDSQLSNWVPQSITASVITASHFHGTVTATLNKVYIPDTLAIGKESPSASLDVKSAANSSVIMRAESSLDTDPLFYIYQDADGDGILRVLNKDDTIKAQLNSNDDSYLTGGKLGIGTDAPSTWLDITSTGTADSDLLYLTNETAANVANIVGQHWKLNTDGAERSAFEIEASFNTIADGTRNSLVNFKTAVAGAYGAAITIDGGDVSIPLGSLTIGSIVAGVSDYDKFLVSDSGLVKFRTGAEVLSDIGASPTSHRHTGQTLENDGITPDSGTLTVTGNVGINEASPDEALHITSSVSYKPVIKLENTNADTSAPYIDFHKISGSPADGDWLGLMYGRGLDSGAAATTYGYMGFKSLDVSAGDEAGGFILQLLVDNVDTEFITLRGFNGSVGEGDVIFNQDGLDIDFRVEAVGVANALFVQGSDGYVGIGGTPAEMLHLTSSVTSKPIIRLENTNADDNSAELNLVKVSGSQADDDRLGRVAFKGLDSASNELNYVIIDGESDDVTDTDEAGRLRIYVRMNDAMRELITASGYNGVVDQGEIILNSGEQDVDFFVKDNNGVAFKIQGSDGNVAIGAVAPIVKSGAANPPWLTLSGNHTGIAMIDTGVADNTRYIEAPGGVMTFGIMDDDGTNASDHFQLLANGNVNINTGSLTIGSIAAGVSDYDKFLVSDSGLVKFRTGAEVLSDIGAAASSHNHSGETLANNGITPASGTLTVAGRITASTGLLDVGVNGGQAGSISVFGDGASSEEGGDIFLYTANDHDTTIDWYGFQAYQDDLIIGPSTNAFSLTYAGADNTWNFTEGSVYVGVDDTTPGSVHVFGDTTSSTEGGDIFLYTAADHDGTIDYYAFQAYEDDLYIGPDTNTDSLVHYGATNAWHFTNGTVRIGVEDTVSGSLTLYGHSAGSAEGGDIFLQTAADYDGSISAYSIQVTSDDLTVGPSTDTDALKYDGGENKWNFSKPVQVTDGTSGWTYGNKVTTTSGTDRTLNASIPSWATEIEVFFNGVSTSGTSQPPIVQLGTTGGFANSAYLCVAANISSTSATETGYNDGFYPHRALSFTSGEYVEGVMSIKRWSPDEQKWFFESKCIYAVTELNMSSGHKELDSELTQIKLTTPGGSATFDLGSARIRYR